MVLPGGRRRLGYRSAVFFTFHHSLFHPSATPPPQQSGRHFLRSAEVEEEDTTSLGEKITGVGYLVWTFKNLGDH